MLIPVLDLAIVVPMEARNTCNLFIERDFEHGFMVLWMNKLYNYTELHMTVGVEGVGVM